MLLQDYSPTLRRREALDRAVPGTSPKRHDVFSHEPPLAQSCSPGTVSIRNQLYFQRRPPTQPYPTHRASRSFHCCVPTRRTPRQKYLLAVPTRRSRVTWAEPHSTSRSRLDVRTRKGKTHAGEACESTRSYSKKHMAAATASSRFGCAEGALDAECSSLWRRNLLRAGSNVRCQHWFSWELGRWGLMDGTIILFYSTTETNDGVRKITENGIWSNNLFLGWSSSKVALKGVSRACSMNI
jgi:hypothetical protein